MISQGYTAYDRQRARQEMLRSYLRLQRELIDGDPGSSAYQRTIHAFRQMGYVLISAGFEEDLDRLLRIRVLEGGRAERRGRDRLSTLPELHVIEQRSS